MPKALSHRPNAGRVNACRNPFEDTVILLHSESFFRKYWHLNITVRSLVTSFVLAGIARAPVLGLPIAVCNYSEAVALLRTWAQNSSAPHLVAAANTHLVTTAHSDKQFAAAMEKFDLVVPDGMPLVWYMNQLCDAGLKDRVYGPDLMRHSLAATDPTDRHFLLGGTEAERQRLEQVLREE
jgi:UDP-N-acetyl-D-mannosaminuronic acid transferase (WecB/TagA/CpsF family)